MSGASDRRTLDNKAARSLSAGAEHYRAYVGPPAEYDLMGATQFRLLAALGLRETDTVLDYGCGALRAGRLLIPYLEAGRYFGWEPNAWLLEDGVAREVGAELVALKRATLLSGPSLDAAALACDFVIAQSILSHTGLDLLRSSLDALAAAMKPDGLMLATYVSGPNLPLGAETQGWVYPGCVRYDWAEIEAALAALGLKGRALPWRHPRQVWFAASRSLDRLPPATFDAHLSGRILGVAGYDAPALNP